MAGTRPRQAGNREKVPGARKNFKPAKLRPQVHLRPGKPPSCPTRVSLSAPSFLKPLFERFRRCWNGPDAPNIDKWHEASQDMCKIRKITAILPPPLGLVECQIEKKDLDACTNQSGLHHAALAGLVPDPYFFDDPHIHLPHIERPQAFHSH